MEARVGSDREILSGAGFSASMANKIAPTQDATTVRLAAIAAHPDAPVRKQFAITLGEKAIDEVARTARFTITTDAVDRDNDTISASGWDIADFLKSPVVLWAHDYSALPVARALDITATGNGLQSTAQFPPKGTYAFADTVFDLIKGGFLTTTSVGFRPLEYTRDDERGGVNFIRQSLLEWSIVPVPANPQALLVARSKGIDLAPLKAWAKAILAKDTAPDTCSVCGADMPDESEACPKCGAPAKSAKDKADGVNGSQTCPQCHAGSAYFDGGFCQACGYAGKPTASASDVPGKDVPPPGTATGPVCQACGTEMAGDVCPGCGWRNPDAEPMTAPSNQLALQASIEKAIATGWSAVLNAESPQTLVERAISVAKRGRELSAANESRIRQAQEHLSAVLSKLDAQAASDDDETEGESGKSGGLMLRDDEVSVDDVIRIRFVDDGENEPVTQVEVLAAVKAMLDEQIGGLRETVREHVSVALARARGRVD